MSNVFYNDVTLPYVTIDDFSEIPVRDPESDTDWYKLKVEVKLHCIINMDYISVIAPDLAGLATNITDIIYALRRRLMEHRRTLSITFNGHEIIPRKMTGVRGTIDADNGPKPQSCRFFQLTNTSFLMQYHIIAHYWEGHHPGDNPLTTNFPGNNVLYNRWSESHEIDSCNFTKRVRQGKYIIRSDNVDGVLADELRSRMAVVSVPFGCIRLGSHYTISPDGLGIVYRAEDQETFRQPPAPAFEARGEYREFGTTQLANRYGECRVQLKGSKLTNQSELLAKAGDIVLTYLNIREKSMGVVWNIIEEMGCSFQFYSNEVEFWARFRTTKDPKQTFLRSTSPNATISIGGGGGAVGSASINGAGSATGNNPINIFAGIPVEVPFDDPAYIPPYLDRGSAGFLLLAAAYYDPSFRNTRLGPGTLIANENLATTTGADNVQMNRGSEPGTAGQAPEG